MAQAWREKTRIHNFPWKEKKNTFDSWSRARGPYSYSRTWNWPITTHKISQPYNKYMYCMCKVCFISKCLVMRDSDINHGSNEHESYNKSWVTGFGCNVFAPALWLVPNSSDNRTYYENNNFLKSDWLIQNSVFPNLLAVLSNNNTRTAE